MKTKINNQLQLTPSILKQIGQPRLALFFSKFADDLHAANIVLPEFCPSNDEYYVALAVLFFFPDFPARPKETMARLKFLAAPENAAALDAAIQLHVPGISLQPTQPRIDHALELWFHNPDAVTDLYVSLTEQSPIEISVPSLPCLPSTTNHQPIAALPSIKNQ